MKNRCRPILVVAGGSGGHILPAVAFYQQVCGRDKDQSRATLVVSDRAKAAAWLSGDDVKPLFIPAGRTPLALARLTWRAWLILRSTQPWIVCAFGGYVGVPFVILAKLCRIKTVIHEQNVVPGRANRWLAVWADVVAVSFEKTLSLWKRAAKKMILVRYPFRQTLERLDKDQARQALGLSKDRFTLVVMGGSQGASRINQVVLETFEQGVFRGRIQVVHLSGRSDVSSVRAGYERLAQPCRVFDFYPRMQEVFSAADLVISRAGAGSVMEILRYGLVSILVPYPHAGAHQRENARVPAEKGASILIEEPMFNAKILTGLLGILVDDQMRRKTMSAIARELYQTMNYPLMAEVIS